MICDRSRISWFRPSSFHVTCIYTYNVVQYTVYLSINRFRSRVVDYRVPVLISMMVMIKMNPAMDV